MIARRPSIAVALAAALAAGATAGAHAAPTHKAKATTKGKTKTVGVVSDYFDPSRVTIAAGDKVKWVWKGTSVSGHDVNVESGPEQFHSDTQWSGSFSHTFKKPGIYKLYCTQHDTMTQTVTVKRRRAAKR